MSKKLFHSFHFTLVTVMFLGFFNPSANSDYCNCKCSVGATDAWNPLAQQSWSLHGCASRCLQGGYHYGTCCYPPDNKCWELDSQGLYKELDDANRTKLSPDIIE